MSETKRWTVTYTKHLKQKRKVYHDGFLEVNGSSKKVMLYDDCEKLIDGRFLKKDETIDCGRILHLEAHIVDIGDPEEGRKPLAAMNIVDVKLKGQAGALFFNEWNALYTTQISQKAKKYHDGTLRVSASGINMNQVILLSEDGEILSSKYLRSVDGLDTGKNYELPNYLIQICEPKFPDKDHKKTTAETVASSTKSIVSEFVRAREVIDNKSPCYGKLSNGPTEQSNNASRSSGRMPAANTSVMSSKTLRDACEILTTLKKPSVEQSKNKAFNTGIPQREYRNHLPEEHFQVAPSLKTDRGCSAESCYTSMVDRLTSEAPQVICSATTCAPNTDQPSSANPTYVLASSSDHWRNGIGEEREFPLNEEQMENRISGEHVVTSAGIAGDWLQLGEEISKDDVVSKAQFKNSKPELEQSWKKSSAPLGDNVGFPSFDLGF